MVKIHCKYFLAYVFLKCLFILTCMFLFHLSWVMSKAETPSPAHTSKKGQKNCDSCHIFMSDLDPHPECSKFLPCSCCMDSSCPHCAPLSQDMWKKWERQQTIKKSSSTTKVPKGESVKGGGNKDGKVYPAVPLYPKIDFPGWLRIAALEAGFSLFKTEIASMFATLTGRFTASHPPDSNTDGSRLEGEVAHGGVFPLREPANPPASQRYLTVPLGPTARPLSGDPSQVAGPSGSTTHTAIAVDTVYGSQWSSGSIDTTLTAKQGATLTGSYRFASTGEVSAGTDPSALTGQRGQPGDAARQPFWHGSIDPNGSTGSASGCRTAAILAWLHRP